MHGLEVNNTPQGNFVFHPADKYKNEMAGQLSRGGYSSLSGRGRSGSSAWSRLKPAITDPLEEFGLPSKGDLR